MWTDLELMQRIADHIRWQADCSLRRFLWHASMIRWLISQLQLPAEERERRPE